MNTLCICAREIYLLEAEDELITALGREVLVVEEVLGAILVLIGALLMLVGDATED